MRRIIYNPRARRHQKRLARRFHLVRYWTEEYILAGKKVSKESEGEMVISVKSRALALGLAWWISLRDAQDIRVIDTIAEGSDQG